MLQKDISQNICYKKILAKTHPNFSPSHSHIHNERCMKVAVEYDRNYFLVEKKNVGY